MLNQEPGTRNPAPRVLMVAFHFPPMKGSSGIQRTLRFVQHLPEFGWEPLVVSAHPRAYPSTGDDDLLRDIPAGTVVERAFALDTARHLSLGGRYLRAAALPDRWITWFPAAVAAGLRLIQRYRPQVLWSTFPIATAHLVGLALQRLTGLPWVADFRDPLGQPSYPSHGPTRKAYWAVERATVRRAARCVFTTPGTLRTYAARYPQLPRDRWCLIENGYDEQSFQEAEALVDRYKNENGAKVLLHSGLLYVSERNPTAFFDVLAELQQEGRISPEKLQVVFRASGHTEEYRTLISARGLESLVRLEPPIAYREALAEMLGADGLLLFQAANCNDQIPAKTYEYLRARRPILALTDEAGDTAAVLRTTPSAIVVPMDSREMIKTAVPNFLCRLESRPEAVQSRMQHSRRERTKGLSRVLDTLAHVTPTETGSEP